MVLSVESQLSDWKSRAQYQRDFNASSLWRLAKVLQSESERQLSSSVAQQFWYTDILRWEIHEWVFTAFAEGRAAPKQLD